MVLFAFNFFFKLCDSLLFFYVACRILVPCPRIRPVSPALEACSLNHLTTRKVPQMNSDLWDGPQGLGSSPYPVLLTPAQTPDQASASPASLSWDLSPVGFGQDSRNPGSREAGTRTRIWRLSPDSLPVKRF